MISAVFVNQHALARNRKIAGHMEPPVRVTQRQESRKTWPTGQKAYRVYVGEPKSGEATDVFYTLENPLRNGVRVLVLSNGLVEWCTKYAPPPPQTWTYTVGGADWINATRGMTLLDLSNHQTVMGSPTVRATDEIRPYLTGRLEVVNLAVAARS